MYQLVITDMEDVPIISIEELKQLIDSDSDYVLIDVRNRDELINGTIPSSYNIPLPELENAFYMSDEEFYKKFHFKRPNKEDLIIFYCRTGGRSNVATQIALSNGYKNCKNFAGSIWKWSEIDNKVKRYGPAPY